MGKKNTDKKTKKDKGKGNGRGKGKKAPKTAVEIPKVTDYAECDTCRKFQRKEDLKACPACGATYCGWCRYPYKGHYSNCQSCGAVL